MTSAAATATAPNDFRTLMLRLDSIDESPRNPRKVFTDMGELTASIAELGVIQPILVRPILFSERFELVCGHRRFRAAKAAGIGDFIPAEIRVLTNAAVDEIQLAENLQRADLGPLEEAFAIDRMHAGDLKTGEGALSIPAIAKRLGKSIRYVARRANVATSLSPKALKAVERPESPLRTWDGAMWDTFALLSHERQDEVAKQCGLYGAKPGYASGYVSLDQLEREVEMQCSELGRAPWKLDDALLVPKAGSCEACPKQSAHSPGLFDDGAAPADIKHAVCSDSACWASKLAAHRKIAIDAARAEHGSDLLFISRGGITGCEHAAAQEAIGKNEKLSEVYNFDKVKKGEKGARPALIVAGEGAGKIEWLKSVGSSSSGSRRGARKPALKEKDKGTQKELAAMVERIETRRAAWIVDHVAKLIAESDGSYIGFETFIRLVRAFGVRELGCDIGKWEQRRKKTFESTDSGSGGDSLWERIKPSIALDLRRFGNAHVEHQVAEARWLLSILQAEAVISPSIDVEALAIAELPDPKSLTKLEAALASPAAAGKPSSSPKKKAARSAKQEPGKPGKGQPGKAAAPSPAKPARKGAPAKKTAAAAV